MVPCGGDWKTKISSRSGRKVERRHIVETSSCTRKKNSDGGPSVRRKPSVRVSTLAVLYQKLSLRPNCTLRGPRSLLSTPNWPLRCVVMPETPSRCETTKTELPNPLKFGWLKRLKNSARNCRRARSVSAKVLFSEKSTFLMLGCLTRPRLRLPNAPGGGSAKANGFRYWVGSFLLR